MAGFKTALGSDEFALVPKKNVARLQMASGLWRHAAQNYKQLEVRAPGDKEVKRGLALASLAAGKVPANADLLGDGDGTNGKYAEAVLALAKGDRGKAVSSFRSIDGENEYAKQILDLWNSKESD
jgi:hypothetical protein